MLKSLSIAVLAAINCSMLSVLPAVAANQQVTLKEALATFGEPVDASPDSIEPFNVPNIVDPSQRALLETISYAEGTWNHREAAIDYSVCFTQKPGTGSLNTDAPHPDQVRRSRSGYASAACGAYQFMPRTWKAMHGWHNKPMTPANQDGAALELAQSVGYNLNQPFASQAYRLASTWASIPTSSGGSYYGQPIKSLQSLNAFYQQRLHHHKQQNHIARNYQSMSRPVFNPVI